MQAPSFRPLLHEPSEHGPKEPGEDFHLFHRRRACTSATTSRAEAGARRSSGLRGKGPGPRRRTGSTSAAWWTGRVGSTGVGARGQGPVPLRPGDGQVQAHAGGRREAEEARRPHPASLPPTPRLTTRVNGGEGIIQTEASELFQGFRANTIQNQYLPGMGWRHR